LKRANWKPSKTDVLCSDHFDEKCFDRTGQIVRLRADSVPTLFKFPIHLQPKITPVRQSKRSTNTTKAILLTPATNINLNSNYVPTESSPVPSESNANINSDHAYAFLSPRSAKRKITHQQEALDKLRKKLKLQQRTSLRLRKQVHSLKDVIESCTSKKLLSDSAAELLNTSFSGISLQLLTRMLSKKQSGGASLKSKYHETLRSFALTLCNMSKSDCIMKANSIHRS